MNPMRVTAAHILAAERERHRQALGISQAGDPVTDADVARFVTAALIIGILAGIYLNDALHTWGIL